MIQCQRADRGRTDRPCAQRPNSLLYGNVNAEFGGGGGGGAEGEGPRDWTGWDRRGEEGKAAIIEQQLLHQCTEPSDGRVLLPLLRQWH